MCRLPRSWRRAVLDEACQNIGRVCTSITSLNELAEYPGERQSTQHTGSQYVMCEDCFFCCEATHFLAVVVSTLKLRATTRCVRISWSNTTRCRSMLNLFSDSMLFGRQLGCCCVVYKACASIQATRAASRGLEKVIGDWNTRRRMSTCSNFSACRCLIYLVSRCHGLDTCTTLQSASRHRRITLPWRGTTRAQYGMS